MRLATERLVLRDFVEADQTIDHGVLGDASATPVQRFDLRDAGGVRKHIRAALAASRDEPRMLFDYAVTRREDERLIGHGGWRLNERETREALVWFETDPATWNQGLLQEACLALFKHCFETVGLHRLTGECSPENAGAMRVMERLGMRREGTLIGNCWREGEWVDTAVFAMLDREWKSR